jgi:hypothetical protein
MWVKDVNVKFIIKMVCIPRYEDAKQIVVHISNIGNKGLKMKKEYQFMITIIEKE